ncbi:ankyrin repeat domain-containing protein 61-like [Chanos chanos]|uniref:Ankyrin repeat domain-containing protein 61-like n=1 Tax=Chanos chanos TaxID=29144 RepID=A0A6J2VHP9_CHACN|nr:ankyrin repeat domain-containing protein 61 [Chanos chanos]
MPFHSCIYCSRNYFTLSLLQNLTILPIHLAAAYKKARSLEILLDSGADPELRDQCGRNTLHLVVTNWPNALTTWPSISPRFQKNMTTMHQRAEDCLRVLCEYGVSLNAPVYGESHPTALHLAVRFRALSAVAILGSHGAKINVSDKFGGTPLHIAAGVLNTKITSCLIEMGADVNMVVRHTGNSALHLAVYAASRKLYGTLDADLECISVLLERGASVDALNKEGHTALHEACHSGAETIVNLLLKHGADINKLTTSGESCLFLFLDKTYNLKHTSLLGKLLRLTSPLTITNKKGLFPRTVMLPEFSKQKDRLMHLAQQPRDLLDICKIHLNLCYSESCRVAFKNLLPSHLYDFVFNHWECPPDLTFYEEAEKSQSSDPFDFLHRFHNFRF